MSAESGPNALERGMAENLVSCFSFDIAAEAEFRFDIVQRYAARFLPQGLDFEDGKRVAGFQYNLFKLGMEPLERIDLEDTFDPHGACNPCIIVSFSVCK